MYMVAVSSRKVDPCPDVYRSEVQEAQASGLSFSASLSRACLSRELTAESCDLFLHYVVISQCIARITALCASRL